MEVTSISPSGTKSGDTSPVATAPREEQKIRRVQVTDLDGPLGNFLCQALPFVAPNAFNAGNWRGKLSTFITSKTSSFICCGRVVGLAHLEQDPMTGTSEAKGLFLLAAEGAEEADAVEILRAHKQWARDLNVGYRPPLKDYCSLSQSKVQVAIKAERRDELFVPPLAPRKIG